MMMDTASVSEPNFSDPPAMKDKQHVAAGQPGGCEHCGCVPPPLTQGGRHRTWSRLGFRHRSTLDRLQVAGDQIRNPVNRLAGLIGAEGPWPTMNPAVECDKAARILQAFMAVTDRNSLSTEPSYSVSPAATKAIFTIPHDVLATCAGLAIFNVFRAGIGHGSLAAGSGVVVARRADGTWSPPCNIIVSTVGAGFSFGLDIYDCVCVLTTAEQVAAFARPRLSLGGDASAALGPVGAGASLQAALGQSSPPVWNYIKSRGLWAGVQIDGTVIVTDARANAHFYNPAGISAQQILAGDRPGVFWPAGSHNLLAVLGAIGVGVIQLPDDTQAVSLLARPLEYTDAKNEYN